MKRPCRPHRGMTYIEVTLSLVILSVAMIGGLRSLGSFAAGTRSGQERTIAAALAQQLMADIVSLPYEETGSTAIGINSGENASNRSTFDDVDDYHGWDVSPPRDRTNAVMTDYSGYRQKVTVEFDTSFASFTGRPLSATSVKKITVTVSHGDRELARVVSIRTRY